MNENPVVRADPWRGLRAATPARIALGRAGGSLPTAQLLDFQLAHAQARDAVHAPFDAAGLAHEIERLGIDTLCLASAAKDRDTYLKRPDLGRKLDQRSREVLSARAMNESNHAAHRASRYDLAVVVSDGLSALAAHRQAAPVLNAWLPLLRAEQRSIAPVVVVDRGRVAIEDEVGALLGARIAVILIGERPGLGSPDSLGAYLVFGPASGNSDADRNCVSNIRPQGLAPHAAALKLHFLFSQALSRQISGIRLKDESTSLAIDRPTPQITHDSA